MHTRLAKLTQLRTYCHSQGHTYFATLHPIQPTKIQSYANKQDTLQAANTKSEMNSACAWLDPFRLNRTRLCLSIWINNRKGGGAMYDLVNKAPPPASY